MNEQKQNCKNIMTDIFIKDKVFAVYEGVTECFKVVVFLTILVLLIVVPASIFVMAIVWVATW